MKKINRNENISILYLIPIIILIAIVPLITRGKVVELSGNRYYYWIGEQLHFDVFTYWKSFWIQLASVGAFIIYIIALKMKKIFFNLRLKYLIPIIVIAFAVIFSTMFAIDKTIALSGFPDMSQGLFVLLSYLFTIIYVATVIDDENSLMIITKCFAFLIIIEGILGITQYFGFDFFRSNIGQNILIPNGIEIQGGLNFLFGPKTIYATLFNTNFVGSFSVLAIPIMLVMSIAENKVKDKILYIVSFVLSIFLWFGCNSRAGYLGLICGLLLVIIMLRKLIIKKWKIFIMIIAISVVSIFALNVLSGNILIHRIKSLNAFNTSINSSFSYKDEFYIKNIESNGSSVAIKTNNNMLHFEYKDNQINVENEEGELLDIELALDGYYNILDNGYKYDLKFQMVENYPGFNVKTPDEGIIYFCIYGDEIKMRSAMGLIYDIKEYEYNEYLNSIGMMASQRGYIWSRSLPLMKDYILYGAGPDNYTLAFPQGDIVGKTNFFESQNTIIIDKPHNLYIQMAINTGLISLIAFLALCVIYVVSVIKTIWKSDYSYNLDKVNLAMLIAIISYLAAGMFNDQINSVAPVFYVLFGLGIATNRMCIAEKERQAYIASKKK